MKTGAFSICCIHKPVLRWFASFELVFFFACINMIVLKGLKLSDATNN